MERKAHSCLLGLSGLFLSLLKKVLNVSFSPYNATSFYSLIKVVEEGDYALVSWFFNVFYFHFYL